LTKGWSYSEGAIVRIKALKIAGIGLIMWGITLLWPEINLLLASPLQLGWLVGAGAIVVMLYLWSERRQLVSSQGVDLYGGKPYWSEVYTGNPIHSRPTRPYAPAQARRHSRATRPMPQS
jgi:hypothetical protein